MLNKPMNKIVKIEGMRCGGCAKRVETALSTFKEIKKVTVDLEQKQALIEFKKELDNQIIIDTINDLGFQATEIK